jgi:hypothetical protein
VKPLIIMLCIAVVWIALLLACALRVGRRRRTGTSQEAGDPFFFAFGEVPTLPQQLHQALHDARRPGRFGKLIPSAKFVMTASNPPPIGAGISRRMIPVPWNSAVVPRRNESDGRRESCPVSSLSSGQGAAVVLTFPGRDA